MHAWNSLGGMSADATHMGQNSYVVPLSFPGPRVFSSRRPSSAFALLDAWVIAAGVSPLRN